ncbi:hypothetical protein BH18ACI5_BH18ACI5_18760 [soil metagenome]
MISQGWRSRLLLPALVLLVAGPGRAQDSFQSSALAAKLSSLLTERQLDAVAAQDPESPKRFVAALLIPGSQLLVVSAQYPAPAELESQVTPRNYRDVYAALHQPSTQQSRFFLIDVGCNGLRAGGDGVDVLYEKGTVQTLFDGRWKQQGLSEAAYGKRLEAAEARYSRLLSILTNSLNMPTTVGKAP